jgi:hypothetical protein
MTFFCVRPDRTTPLLLLLALTLLAAVSSSCGDSAAPPPPAPEPAGFTFFNLGASSVLTDAIRKNLESQLGPYAIETRSIINLEVNYRGFLKEHFPALHQLNRRLNSPAGERVDHSTRKLMFRQTRRQKIPFERVFLVFSGYSQTPLFFSIHMPQEGQETLTALTDKYGPPGEIAWGDNGARTLFWREGADVMLATISTNVFGNPEYHIIIYFGDNLEALIQTEQEEIQQRQEQLQQRGVKAF